MNITHKAQQNTQITIFFLSLFLCGVHTIDSFTLDSCNNTNIDFLCSPQKINSPLRVILTLGLLSPIFTSWVNES